MRSTAILLLLILAGCGMYWNHAGDDVRLFAGDERDSSSIAILDQGSGCWACVRTITRPGENNPIYTPPRNARSALDYPNKIKLLPGKYTITITYRARKSTTASHTGMVDLLPGHSYSVLNDVCFGICFTVPSYTTFVWIEDSDTGEVVLGKKL